MKRRTRLARAFEGVGGRLAQRVHAAVHVGVQLRLVVLDGVEHRARALRGGGAVEVDQRLAVHSLREERESRRARAAASAAPRCDRSWPGRRGALMPAAPRRCVAELAGGGAARRRAAAPGARWRAARRRGRPTSAARARSRGRGRATAGRTAAFSSSRPVVAPCAAWTSSVWISSRGRRSISAPLPSIRPRSDCATRAPARRGGHLHVGAAGDVRAVAWRCRGTAARCACAARRGRTRSSRSSDCGPGARPRARATAQRGVRAGQLHQRSAAGAAGGAAAAVRAAGRRRLRRARPRACRAAAHRSAHCCRR